MRTRRAGSLESRCDCPRQSLDYGFAARSTTPPTSLRDCLGSLVLDGLRSPCHCEGEARGNPFPHASPAADCAVGGVAERQRGRRGWAYMHTGTNRKRPLPKPGSGLFQFTQHSALRTQHFFPFSRKSSTFSSRAFRNASISSTVVSRLMETRNAPSMTSPGSFMALSTWLR